MDALVELCADDKEALDFVLKYIDEHFNDIYDTNATNATARVFSFGSMRNEEYTPQYGKAVERRRISNKILKLKAKEA